MPRDDAISVVGPGAVALRAGSGTAVFRVPQEGVIWIHPSRCTVVKLNVSCLKLFTSLIHHPVMSTSLIHHLIIEFPVCHGRASPTLFTEYCNMS